MARSKLRYLFLPTQAATLDGLIPKSLCCMPADDHRAKKKAARPRTARINAPEGSGEIDGGLASRSNGTFSRATSGRVSGRAGMTARCAEPYTFCGQLAPQNLRPHVESTGPQWPPSWAMPAAASSSC